ncbi:MAG: 23S rRNA (adenine(2503)-C(2))-methyltransferase RlmN [Holophagaceae bacterium]|jgi:23S rRNA (adenine2503-C2)-methyltransferase|nr:23S rRNA (adenine(2503)-C(2))-methyltransferase RlmN [Acidobacteriota bacterium]
MVSAWDQPAPELNGDLGRSDLLSWSPEECVNWMRKLGQPDYRGDQLFRGIHQQRWSRWSQFSIFPEDLRTALAGQGNIDFPVITLSQSSQDGSTKHVFKLRDGLEVEGVFMPYPNRITLCLSSQVGCAMGCTFCATGDMGIKRNLTAGEMIGQVLGMLEHHRYKTTGRPTDTPLNIVFMGMGEPLHNLDHVMKSFHLLSHPKGLGISAKRITLSTSGLVPGIDRLGTYSPRPKLAVSLNGSQDDYRSKIMPVNRVWNLSALKESILRFPLGPREWITLEYVLLKNITDRPSDMQGLLRFAHDIPCKINLIPFNPHEGSGFETPSESRISQCCQILAQTGLIVSVRRSRGQDIAGACGQLVREED